MYKLLKWNKVNLESKTKFLYDILVSDLKSLPNKQKKERKKLQGFIDELNYLQLKINQISTDLIPKLQLKIGIQFTSSELIFIALSRPSVRNIFENLKIYFKNGSNNNPQKLNEEELNHLDILASLGDASNVLALIGDSALNLATSIALWDNRLTTSGAITKKKEKIVSNANLAEFSNRFNLYNYRIKIFKDESEKSSKKLSVNAEKGTLIEAIFGVIYLEHGLDGLTSIVPLLYN